MLTLKRTPFASVFVLVLLAPAWAQDRISPTAPSSSVTITAAAFGERVRIAAPSSIVQLHVEVYAAGGDKLFDQEIRGGNVFDWGLQDAQGQRLAPGTYVCVVTTKSVSGKLTQRLGTVNVAEKSVSVQPMEPPLLSAALAQTIGPMEENSSWILAGQDGPQTPTLIAHDGTDGQMIRGRGALTFRLGNLFSGIDKEQMRLTESGNLGIGTSEPGAKLEVAGTIRAERFLVAKPKLINIDKTSEGAPSAEVVDSAQPLVAGSGTQNRVTKWTDNVGTLGDSGITETSGFVGIGTTNPDSLLNIQGAIAAPLGRLATVRTTGSNHGFGLMLDATGTGNNNLGLSVNGVLKGGFSFDVARHFMGFVNSEAGVADFALRLNTDGSLTFHDGSVYPGPERFRISKTGDVNINGNAVLSGGTINAYFGFNFAGGRFASGNYTNTVVGLGAGHSSQGESNTFVGKDAGQKSTTGSYNSLFGLAAGLNNTTGFDNSMFGTGAGTSNTTGSYNSFFGYLAGTSNTTGEANAFFGDDAGLNITTGNNNSFFGTGAAAYFNGSNNTFIGHQAGAFGFGSGESNTLLGARTAVNNSLSNATAIGANALVTQSNSLVLGADGTSVGIGTSAPQQKLHLNSPDTRLRIQSTAGGAYTEIKYHTDARVWNAGVGGSTVTSPVNSKYYIFDETAGQFRMAIDTNGRVGIGTTSPDQTLSVNGNASKTGGGSWLAFSDLRLKHIKGRFTLGLNAVMQLQPLRYEYKRDNPLNLKSEGEHVGFSAQSVQRVIPEAVTKDDRGYLLVNNDPIMWTMLNAIKEQQAQIQQQQKQIDGLKKLACRAHRRTAVCK